MCDLKGPAVKRRRPRSPVAAAEPQDQLTLWVQCWSRDQLTLGVQCWSRGQWSADMAEHLTLGVQ